MKRDPRNFSIEYEAGPKKFLVDFRHNIIFILSLAGLSVGIIYQTNIGTMMKESNNNKRSEEELVLYIKQVSCFFLEHVGCRYNFLFLTTIVTHYLIIII